MAAVVALAVAVAVAVWRRGRRRRRCSCELVILELETRIQATLPCTKTYNNPEPLSPLPIDHFRNTLSVYTPALQFSSRSAAPIHTLHDTP